MQIRSNYKQKKEKSKQDELQDCLNLLRSNGVNVSTPIQPCTVIFQRNNNKTHVYRMLRRVDKSYNCLNLKIKAPQSLETSVTIYQSTWCKISEDLNLQLHGCENLKCLKINDDLLRYNHI
jgi:hypothetical protein